jgi:ProP effector
MSNANRKPVLRLKLKDIEKAPSGSGAGASPLKQIPDGTGNGPTLARPERRVKQKDNPKLTERRYCELRKFLARRFPRCFVAARPLMIGIDAPLLAACRDLTRRDRCDILKAIAQYTSSTEYLQAMTEGAARINLNGEAAGVVWRYDEEHSKHLLARKQASTKGGGR